MAGKMVVAHFVTTSSSNGSSSGDFSLVGTLSSSPTPCQKIKVAQLN